MICEKCGAENKEDAKFCMRCGGEFVPKISLPDKPIKTHMTAAIITTVLLASWILGIPAIVFAKECEIARAKGQYEIAQRFSKRAMTFLCIGSALSVALFSFIVFITVLTRKIMLF